MPHQIFIGLSLFLGFTIAGAGLARLSISAPQTALVVDGILLMAILVMRARRLSAWRTVPLEFEDVLPTELNPLRLRVD